MPAALSDRHAGEADTVALHFSPAELRRAGDVSPLILREPHNQGIDILHSPHKDLHFHRSQNNRSGEFYPTHA